MMGKKTQAAVSSTQEDAEIDTMIDRVMDQVNASGVWEALNPLINLIKTSSPHIDVSPDDDGFSNE
jgi:hypothetical protein